MKKKENKWEECKNLYLNLMKKTLCFMLWSDVPIPITSRYIKSLVKRFLVSTVSKILKIKKLQLVLNRSYPIDKKIKGEIWPMYAHTMVGLKNLDNLQFAIETIIKEKVKGDLIETGVWRGGVCIFMRSVLAAYGIKDRKVFVADSFEGLPKPDIEKYPVDKGDTHYKHTFLTVSQNEVKNNFKKYGLMDNQVIFLKGWFKNTLPNAPIKKLSVLRLDGDMYGSTIDALNNLYPKLSKGGFCIVDDYSLPNCKKAVDGYRAKHEINTKIKEIVKGDSIYWRKE